MPNTRIIKAVFGASKSIVAPKRFKNDYGQEIEFVGIELPDVFEAHFSNSKSGQAKKQIGRDNRVTVPDEYFVSGADVFCWVMVHDAATDGRTMYTVRIPVMERPEPINAEPTPVQQDVIAQAITALNDAVAQTAEDVQAADASARSASDSADRAETARDTAEGYVSTVQNYAQQAQASASNASASATASAQSASTAQQIKTDVQGLVSDAQSAAGASAQSALESAQSASQASTSASSASQSADTASTKASEASASAQTASAKATEASEYASTASQKASESSQSASAASGYATQAGQAKTAAETAQGLAEQAQSDAESAKDDAESARDTAQQIVSGISGKVEQIDQNTADIASLEADRYKAYATDTATGAVASFSDGADNIPMADVKVSIEPVQDLHGYDSPWPAGGGKNLFDIDGYLTDRSASYTKSGDTYTITASTSLFTDQYVFSDTDEQVTISYDSFANGTTTNVRIDVIDTNGTIVKSIYPNTGTQTVTVNKMRFNWTNQGNFTISKLQIERGSFATAYTPYSNICPISGWNGANVSRIGKNWFDLKKFAEVYPQNCSYNETTGELNISSTSRLYSVGIPVDIPLDTSNGGFMQWEGMNGTGTNFRFRFACSDGTVYDQTGSTGATTGYLKYTSQIAAKRITSIRINWTTPGTFTIKNACITQGTNDVPYEPYIGNTYPITFPSEAGTVYGGTLDVTTGELVVDRANIASYNGETLPSTWISDRDVYSAGTTPTTGAQVVYELAELIHYTLDATEIRSLLGRNNLFSDTGDSTAEYRADTKLYISKKIAEAISALS